MFYFPSITSVKELSSYCDLFVVVVAAVVVVVVAAAVGEFPNY